VSRAGFAAHWVPDAAAVRYAMRRAGYLLGAELASACGLDRSVVNAVLRGEKPHVSASTMCDLAAALGCDVMDLMKPNGTSAFQGLGNPREGTR